MESLRDLIELYDREVGALQGEIHRQGRATGATDPGVDADALAHRVAEALPGTTVQTRAEFARQEANVVRDMAADVMKIVAVIGFLIALAVIGLTLFTATLAKLREYGILKALGAGSGRLAATVAAQAAWSVALGLAVAVAVSVLLGAAIGAVTRTWRWPSRPEP